MYTLYVMRLSSELLRGMQIKNQLVTVIFKTVFCFYLFTDVFLKRNSILSLGRKKTSCIRGP